MRKIEKQTCKNICTFAANWNSHPPILQTEHRSNVFLHLRNWWYWHQSLDAPRLNFKSTTNFYTMSARSSSGRSLSFNAEVAEQFDQVLSAYRRDWGDSAFRLITAELGSHETDSDRIRAARAGIPPGKYWQSWRETLDQITWLCGRLEYDLDVTALG